MTTQTSKIWVVVRISASEAAQIYTDLQPDGDNYQFRARGFVPYIDIV
jgi:hypothetical protein